MQGVIQLSEPWTILMLRLRANTPNDESSVNYFGSQFADLHPDSDIRTEEHQLEEILAPISKVVLLDEILQQSCWLGGCCVTHM